MTDAGDPLLDPLSLPLRGSRLIEASAGTGKTWTIAALYLRLVLGHGAEGQRPARALLPGEILVLTFTKAATRELSDRIRARLVEAAAVFRGEPAPKDDDFLPRLLAQYPDGAQRRQAAWRLALAAEAMDEAAVTTIDAWCQRMLREHAFDSGCLFDEELQANEAGMLATAARDYWRQQVYPLADEALATTLQQWPDVEALAGRVKALLDRPLPEGAGGDSLAQCIERDACARATALAGLKRGWAGRADEMQRWLEVQWQRKDCALDRRVLGPANGRRWIEALRNWAADPDADALHMGKGAKRLTASGMLGAVKSGFTLELPASFAAFETLVSALQQLPEPGPALLAHAASRIRARIQALKTESGRFGFADMLDRLDAALDERTRGDKASRLRQRIVGQFPVALVDEFQDTSPVQLSIFDRLYRIDADDPAPALLLIGDPKQAIYGFRGADIYSYLRARAATAGRHHVLGVNRRSTSALVAAVNHCFAAAEDRPGVGAFMFRGDDAGLPFVPVRAHGRAERLLCSAGAVPAMAICLDAELRAKDDSRALFAALCAERIVALLDDAGAGFVPDGKPFVRLRPADIAVLVRTGTEAAAVRQALRRRGVASVYLSDKDTVFASDEARDLLRLLQAVAAPRDMRLARAALATSLLGLTLAELLALAGDDEAFDARCELLQQLHADWSSQGVLAMLRRALHAFDLPARWLAAGEGASDAGIEGERRLTNVLHLAELLQAASAQAEGEQALIRWMSQQVDAAAAGRAADDEQVLRLESDADLVQVVTVHKSKGLEYPLVFLPFAAHYRAVERRGSPVVFLPDGRGRRRAVLAPTDVDLTAADKERLREDLRLLYVALTRARHALWVGAAALKIGNSAACVWHRSAIGCLLSGAGPRTPPELAADVWRLAAAGVDIVVQAAAPPAVTGLHRRATRPPLPDAPAYAAHFDRRWSISSYSALVKDIDAAGRGGAAAVSDAPTRLLRDDEPEEADAAAADTPPPADQPWHRFVRGAHAGNFLHGLLQWLAGEGFALDDDTALQQALAARCERQGWADRSADVLAWLRRVCVTPLPPLGVSLAGLAIASPEMEFWLPSDGLDAARVDALCRQHILPGRPRPALPARTLRGMLMGYADLVYAHGERCGVLDYKSNVLGACDADYTAAAMAAAMLAHRYDVQAALYLLALHRLLKSRLRSAYAPDRHLHGAVFLFLRGVRSPGAGCFHLPPPVALIEALDAMLVAGEPP